MIQLSVKEAAPAPVSVRLEAEQYEELAKLIERYPLISRSKMLIAAVEYWLEDARNGIDANLRPLKRRVN